MRVFRDHRLFRLKFHFTVRLSRDLSPRKQSWPLMVYYFLTTTWRGRDDRFSGIGNKVSPAVHGCTSSNTENVSLFLALSFFLSFTCTHGDVYTAGYRSVSRRVSSQPPRRIPDPLAPLCFDCFALCLSLSLSRSVFLSLFHAVSSSFPSNVSAFRLLSSACLSDGGNERVRIEVSRRALLTGRGEKRTLSKCYPLGPSLPFSFLFFFLSLILPCRLFFSSSSPYLSVPPVERRSMYRRTA